MTPTQNRGELGVDLTPPWRQDKEGTDRARGRGREGGREIFIIVVHYPHFFFDLMNYGEM